MNVNLLVDAIVRQTTVLIAQLATSAGARATLAHTANEVFLDLVGELKAQGLGNKVIADMFGLTLRGYHHRVARLSESTTERGRSLWEALSRAAHPGRAGGADLREADARNAPLGARRVENAPRPVQDAALGVAQRLRTQRSPCAGFRARGGNLAADSRAGASTRFAKSAHMERTHVVIVGGGLAGLSAGRYARANGFRTTVVEHNLELGGVCTAWARGPYTVDGCIHWLTGGPFDQIYRELGIFPKVSVHPLKSFATYRDAKTGASVEFTSDLAALARALVRIAPEDEAEILRMVKGAEAILSMHPPIDHPPEIATLREALGSIWEMRANLGTLVHFRKPVGTWVNERFSNEQVRRIFARLVPPEAPAFFLLMVLGYLSRGYLSRPGGGTARFRDALIESYRNSGGEARVHETVDEILVDGDRVCGVRLSDGTELAADHVISTSSAPETMLRLLGGRYGASELRKRLETWKLFDPIVLATYGVTTPLSDIPSTLIVDQIAPIDVGGRKNEHLYLRIYNDDSSFAPTGHTVVQAMFTTDYSFWARLGANYTSEKYAVADRILRRIEAHLPPVKGTVDMVDVATPLTYFNMARSYRGAFEGWMPTPEAFFGHVKKTLPGLSHFYMAGQWVEPGGGVPTALMSGRQAVQILCADEGRTFVAPSVGPGS